MLNMKGEATLSTSVTEVNTEPGDSEFKSPLTPKGEFTVKRNNGPHTLEGEG